MMHAPTSPLLQDEDNDICWICLGPGSSEASLDRMPCMCPRWAHAKCIARWQLQSAGTRRETNCEFCDAALPDWKESFKLPSDWNPVAVMNVTFGGVTKRFGVEPGEDGYRKFISDVHAAFHLPAEGSSSTRRLSMKFKCYAPATMENDTQLILTGAKAFDAAVHCAALSAARHGDRTCSRQALANSPAQPAGRPEKQQPSIAQRRPSSRIGSYLKKRLRIVLADLAAADTIFAL